MTEPLFLLGKSTYALSIILDMLPGEFQRVGLISNIPDAAVGLPILAQLMLVAAHPGEPKVVKACPLPMCTTR